MKNLIIFIMSSILISLILVYSINWVKIGKGKYTEIYKKEEKCLDCKDNNYYYEYTIKTKYTRSFFPLIKKENDTINITLNEKTSLRELLNLITNK